MQKFPTGQAAAESLGMKGDTYTAYERRPDSSKHTRLDDQAAIRYGRKFGVRWQWLLTGEGEPFDENAPQNPPEERVIQALRDSSADPAERERTADAIIALLRGAKR